MEPKGHEVKESLHPQAKEPLSEIKVGGGVINPRLSCLRTRVLDLLPGSRVLEHSVLEHSTAFWNTAAAF